MEYEYLDRLRQNHPAMRLLSADSAPLIAGFLFMVFVEPNRRSLPLSEIESFLSDYLLHLREIYGEKRYPRAARAYLDEWANPEKGYLRKFYPEQSDEPEYDLTPGAALAIDWLQSLKERQFIGTESRLLTVFELLRDIVRRTEQDPEARIQELERQKEEIEQEIEDIRTKGVAPHDSTQIKERFFQAEETGRRLLADFRQVEYNFRTLDRQTRELIAVSDKPKGELLDEIFRDQDVIRDSDQGKSFQSFWELLMSRERQAELRDLLKRIYELPEIRELGPEEFLARIKFSLLDAGEKVYKTGNLLVEQLRRFLDDYAWLENRRIMEILREIEKKGVEVKNSPPSDKVFTTLDDIRPRLDLPMNRGLFFPPRVVALDSTIVEEGEPDVETDLLFDQVYVDERRLAANIRKALQTSTQISLTELIKRFPLEKGLAELVGYLNLAARENRAVIDEETSEALFVLSTRKKLRKVRIPRVVFVR